MIIIPSCQILHSNFDRTNIMLLLFVTVQIADQRFSMFSMLLFEDDSRKTIHKYSYIVTTVDHICDVRRSVDVRLICSSPYFDLFLNISLVINCVAYKHIAIRSCFVFFFDVFSFRFFFASR